jgi:hypothetical protein
LNKVETCIALIPILISDLIDLSLYLCSNFQLFKVLNFAEGKVIELYAKHTNCANQLE